MPIITRISSTGFAGEYSTTSGNYTIAGKFSCDEDKAIIKTVRSTLDTELDA